MATPTDAQVLSDEIDELLQQYLGLLDQYTTLRSQLSSAQATVCHPTHRPSISWIATDANDDHLDPAEHRPRKLQRRARHPLWRRLLRRTNAGLTDLPYNVHHARHGVLCRVVNTIEGRFRAAERRAAGLGVWTQR